jgi:hypothetical protein
MVTRKRGGEIYLALAAKPVGKYGDPFPEDLYPTGRISVDLRLIVN